MPSQATDQDVDAVSWEMNVTDLAGNKVTFNASVATNRLSIDASRPQLAISISSDGAKAGIAILGDKVTLVINVSEPVASIEGTMEGVQQSFVQIASTKYTSTLPIEPGTTEGTLYFSISCRDPAGNPGGSSVTIDGSSVSVDSKKPEILAVTLHSSNPFDSSLAVTNESLRFVITVSEIIETPAIKILEETVAAELRNNGCT